MSKKHDYGGMTTNERLYAAGLLEQFDAAARTRNRNSIVDILMQVDVSQTDAIAIAEKILIKPERYGY